MYKLCIYIIYIYVYTHIHIHIRIHLSNCAIWKINWMILVCFLIVIYDRVLMIVSRQSNTEPKIGILIWSFLLKKPPCVGDIHPRLITEGTRLGHPAVQVLCWSNEKTSCRCCTEVNSQGQETRNDESLGSSYRFYHSLICEYLFNMKNAAVYIYIIFICTFNMNL